MNENLQPVADEHLEARITAYLLGEASPFEAAEIEELISKSPELKLFANRTRTLNGLLKEAETTSNSPDSEWKLSGKRRIALSPLLGPSPVLVPHNENRIRRASFRAAWGIAAIFIVTFFTLRLVPSDYEAEAIIEIKRRQSPVDPLGGAISGSPSMTASYFGTEFEKVKSRNSLEKVVDSLDLTTRWNTDKETAIKRLKENVETKNIRGTDLISIRVRDANEEDAKEITREVTKSYRDYRNELEKRSAEEAVLELQKAIRAQEDKVEGRRQTLTSLSRSQNYVYRRGAGALADEIRDASKKAAVEAHIDTSDYNEAQNSFETDQKLLETMKLQLFNQELNQGLDSSVVIHDMPEEPKDRIAANAKTTNRAEAPPTAAPEPKAQIGSGASSDELAEVQRKPKAPASAMAKVIAANAANPVAIPVPDVDVLTPSADFGDGTDFGGGWGDEGEKNEALAMRERNPGSAGADFINPVNGATIPGIPAEDTLNVNGIVTGGLRSGDQAVNRNTIDAILNNPDRTAQAGKKMRESEALQDAPADSFLGIESLAHTDRSELTDGDEKSESGGLALESQKKLEGTDGLPIIETRSMSGLAQREIIRRQGLVAEADRKLVDGREAYQKGDFETARKQFDDALTNLPESPATKERRDFITEHLGLASVAEAQQMRKVGKYDEARALLEKAAASGGGNQEEIKAELGYLDDPIRTNPALTYEHNRQVDEVRRNLYMAEGNMQLGKFDEAKKVYEETLRIDPSNAAARRGMEKVESAKSDYYRAAYDTTRSDMLAQVDKNWELSVPQEEREKFEGDNRYAQARLGVDLEDHVTGFTGAWNNFDSLTENEAPFGIDIKGNKETKDKIIRREVPVQISKWFSSPSDDQIASNGSGIAGDMLAENAPAISDETRYKMDFRAGAERGESDEIISFTGLFSEDVGKEWNGKAGTRLGGLKSDLSQLQEADSPDMGSLFSGNGREDYRFQSGDTSQFLFRGTDLSGAFKAANSGATLGINPNLTPPAGFEGFANYGSPIQAEGETKPGDLDLRREVPPMPKFFPAPDPTVITRSGASANMEVLREFIYPSEYEAPEIPVPGAVSPASPPVVNESDADLAPILGDIPVLGRLFQEKAIDLADLSNEVPAAQEPFSTFSLNISDASFQVASSAVAKGERPDPESIKPEQFYNGVSYDDPAPSTGEPVAAAIGQLAHPVIPRRNLVRMSVRTASTGRAATQPLVLTLLVDQSGSMARDDRRAAMDKALAQLATLMQPDDRITVIGFSRTPRLLADSISGEEAGKLPDIINQASSEGGTNLEQAINLAESLALRHKADGAQNRIVLFTDGAANLGNADPERLAGRVKALRQQDLAFDIAGIGTDDINDQLLSELARHGNGRYYLVGENTGESLAKQLAGAFRPAAENVKIQVKFNPQRVGNYKLIGFEKDRLKTEDFRNDAVDAAELAADESGTALYQVEPLADGSGEIGELYVRFRDTATGEMVERSWTIPYEAQAPAIDKAQPPMQLAALSMLAAQKLQPGPLADAINFRDLAPTIAAVKQAYARSPEAQQMITLINALK